MKNLLLYLAAGALACSCSSSTCSIHGTFSDPVDSVKLISTNGFTIDECPVTDGSFNLSCDIDPQGLVILLRGEDYDPICLVPDSKDITVSIKDSVPVATGSPLSKELLDLQQWAFKTFMASPDEEQAFQAITDHCREIYPKHTSDAIGLQALSLMAEIIDPDEFASFFEQGGRLIQSDASLGGYYRYLRPESDSLANKNFVIQLMDDGTVQQSAGTFEDFVGNGKYTLVDFWASWCGPCRKETPNVVAVYNKYRDKGLVVIGIPVNDTQEETKEAMKQLGIHYPQLIDPSQSLAELFNVEGIPYIILFDKNGQILAKDIRGKQIEEAISKLPL